MTNAMTEVDDQVRSAFRKFCRENGWTEAEILTLQMLSAIKEGPDLVVEVIRQRENSRKNPKWFTKLPFWPVYYQLED